MLFCFMFFNYMGYHSQCYMTMENFRLIFFLRTKKFQKNDVYSTWSSLVTSYLIPLIIISNSLDGFANVWKR